MSKSGKDPVKLFDVRLQERNIIRGVITRKDIARHIESLPDVASKSMTLAQAEADRIARMPPPPTPTAPSTPIVRAYPAPPSDINYDDLPDDDDDDLDDDLDDESDDEAKATGAAADADNAADDDLGDDDDEDDDGGDPDEEPPAPIA